MPAVAKKIALYTRVSTDNQLRPEGSLDTQEARLRSFVVAKGFDDEDVVLFREEGQSGKSLDRPQLKKLRAAMRRGEISKVMVTRLDRLSRSLLGFFDLHADFEAHEVQFISINENFDTTTPTGRAMLKIILVFAELEREQTAERTRQAMKARAERGLWNGGRPTLGYDRVDSHLIPNPEEAELVKLIFTRYVELRSAPKLAKWLNDQGHRQKVYMSRRKGRTGGKKFTSAVVRSILRNVLYIGRVTYKGEMHDGQHEGIVPETLFERVQGIMDGNAKNRRGPPTVANHTYPLSGVLRCSCGYALTTSAGTSQSGQAYAYYRCVGLQKSVEHKCEVRQIRAEVVEKAVFDLIRQAATKPELVQKSVERANELAAQFVQPLKQRVEQLKKDLAVAEEEGERTLQSILRSGVEGNDLARKLLRDNEERRRQLRRALDQAEGELAARETEHLDLETVRQALEMFDEVWEALEPAEQRDLLRLMLAEVVVHPDRVELELYDGRGALSLLDAESQNDETPGVNQHQEFVAGMKWLPLLDSNQ